MAVAVLQGQIQIKGECMKEVIIPNLTDEEFSLWNDVSKMNKIIDELLAKLP